MSGTKLTVSLFQFLIGRLKTEHSPDTTPDQPEFQFLIGRLKTRLPHLHKTLSGEFQFLIGRLKTY